jgi:hypothetical protein
VSSKPWIVALLVPSAALFFIQGFGASATDSQFHAIYDFPQALYWPVVLTATILSAVAPITSVCALWVAFASPRSMENRRWILLICLALVVTSWVGCAWTYGGHPTWTQGYSGTKGG